jgi:uncharacterized protein (TIGR00369 family)
VNDAADLNSARRAARERGDFSLLRQRVPYAAFLDMRVTLDGQSPQYLLPFRKSLIGNSVLQALHGGAVAGFMESAALLHLLLLLDETRLPKSIDFSIDYLRSANAQDSYAACEVTRQGRRVAQVQIRCWQAETGHPGKTRDVALARAHFLLSDSAAD